MKKKFVYSLVLLALFISLSNIALARIGVGVGTGKIVVDEPLAPGVIYELPPLTVFNTGDTAAEYSVRVAYHQDQPEKRPPGDWFRFKPERFHLEPNDARRVDITMNVPIKTEPGDYFAYVEGFPIKSSANGETSIGIAAAAKLYFNIAPANIFQGIYYRLKSFWFANQPYSNIVLGLIFVIVIIRYILKNFKISVSTKRTKEDNTKKEDEK